MDDGIDSAKHQRRDERGVGFLSGHPLKAMEERGHGGLLLASRAPGRARKMAFTA
ncbi:MAG: hypothetical protein JSS16_04110 [Proteobacteria bacterium]|nr:hypothetical protein [Pseudomonadota bacterium]